jgi:putative acetyltransferase
LYRGKITEIRSEQPEDIAIIRQITKVAFAPKEYSSQTEAAIVDALRGAGALTVSLVAVIDGEVVGHVAVSPVTIDGEHRCWYGLGPVSVRPDRQKEGIGGKLIREGLARLAKADAKGCVVLGDPGYYKRFGFENDPGLRFEEAPAKYFMRLAFGGPAPSGRVAYHDGFNAT